MEAYLGLFRRVIGLFASVAIWRALLGESGQVGLIAGSVSLREMVTYVVVSAGISVFVSLFEAHSPLWRIEDRVRSGSIGTDLLRPMGLGTYLFCETIGYNLFEIVTGLAPLVALAALVFGLDPPAWRDLPFFGIALLNGLLLYFTLSYLLGLLAFWYQEIWHLERFLAELIWLFSGARVPLWFYPPALDRASSFLPFRLVYFVPISIYLGRMGRAEILAAIVQQGVWIVALGLLGRVLWAAGIKKLVVQGG
jgi:ABC-2 type transport system permease protein